MNADAIVQLLRQRLPEVMAVYAFGSRIQGTADADSDLDLAVLVPGYAEPVALWSLASEVADLAGCHVDLLDMRAASTVMQHQVLTTGVTWWRRDDEVMMWEAAMLNEMLKLHAARKPAAGESFGEAIERHVRRAREEYDRGPDSFATDFTRQDAAILNIQRACEAALDMGQHLIRRDQLGLPQSARQVFDLLAQAGHIDVALAEAMKRMVGFRNIAVHEYQKLQLPITVAIIRDHLDEFLQYSRALIQRPAPAG